MSTPTWIIFEPREPNPKTKVWAVITKEGRHELGVVSWYGPWRKYGFFPAGGTAVFEWVCLREIADFCENETNLHRAPKVEKAEDELTALFGRISRPQAA